MQGHHHHDHDHDWNAGWVIRRGWRLFLEDCQNDVDSQGQSKKPSEKQKEKNEKDQVSEGVQPSASDESESGKKEEEIDPPLQVTDVTDVDHPENETLRKKEEEDHEVGGGGGITR